VSFVRFVANSFSVDLSLASGVLESVTEHAKSVYPNEGCGLLVGRQTAERFIPMRNAAASETHFEMDPGQLIAVLRDLRDAGETLIAIYHSHPHGPSEPSTTDVARAYYPEAAHLIISLADLERPQAAAFRILDGEILPIELRVIV